MISMREKIKIEFKNKIYEIDKENIDYIISKLENNPTPHPKKDIPDILKHYKLLDESFLEGMSEIG